MNEQSASFAIVLVCSIGLILLFWFTIFAPDPVLKRVKVLVARREELKSHHVSTDRPRARLTHSSGLNDKLRDFLGKMSMLQESQLAAVRTKLAHAGIRNRDMALRIIFARLVAPIFLGVILGILLYIVDIFPKWSPITRYMVLAVTLVLAYKGPDIWIHNLANKRTTAIRLALPDALDLMVICAEAGLTMDATFARVGKELEVSFPEMADEFLVTSRELGFLSERRQALENLSNRINLEAVKGVTTTMVQTEKYGTPLAAALRTLSAEFRHDRMMRAEAKAARLPAVMTVPLIVFILPVLFIVILGPAACSIADRM